MMFIFIWFLFMSILMSLSSSSLFFIWICLEVNMMSFIPLMFNKSMTSMNSVISYFLIQSSASSVYIFSISSLFLNFNYLIYLNILISLSMLMKLGASPFHMWLPQVSESMTYNTLLTLLTIQKIIPLQVISMFVDIFMIIPIILSSISGTMGGFNQFSIRKILAFSSISHMAWIMTLMLISSNFWMIYLTLYSLITFSIILIMKTYKIDFINFNKKINMNVNFFIIIMLLSLGGMPPTLGFMMKWITLKIILKNFISISIPLIMSSLINLYFYLRLSYNSMLKFMNFHKWEKLPLFNLFLLLIPQTLMIFLMIPLL
nr:NADH dehydrogenase subunit 2 [Alectorobius spheniscus]